jgi:putative pyruvate formate lyase activating enzyme
LSRFPNHEHLERAERPASTCPADIIRHCNLCGHGCGVDRTQGRTGRCGLGVEVRVAAHLLHFGEEPPISGSRGSGTIFFTGCPLTCIFCQNYQISQDGMGRAVDPSRLADVMIDLQARGAHNINLVSPTPWGPCIIEAFDIARLRGLHLPVVYNTGGYDSLEALSMMENYVDIYLPDAKYGSSAPAAFLSGARDYVSINRAAILEMHRQCGPMTLDADGLARRGILIRHLVLPGDLAGTRDVLTWLACELGPETYLSLMAQYRPFYKTAGECPEYPELNRPLTADEYDAVVDTAWELGLENTFVQELDAVDCYVPDFNRPEVFTR